MSAWAVASNDDTVGPSRVPPLGPFASTSPSISSAVTRRWTVERGRFASLAMAVRLSPPGCALSARMMAAVRDTTCTPALGYLAWVTDTQLDLSQARGALHDARSNTAQFAR